MAQGILSKGIKLLAWAKEGSSGTAEYLDLYGLQSIPSLGGDVDKVETTCLADSSRTYINGLRDYGDLEFKFLYVPKEDMGTGATNSNYQKYAGLDNNASIDLQVELPDSTKFYFPGQVSLSIDEAEVNAALTFTLKVGLSGDIVMTAPTTHHDAPVLTK